MCACAVSARGFAECSLVWAETLFSLLSPVGFVAWESLMVVLPARVSTCSLSGDSVAPLVGMAVILAVLGLGVVEALVGFGLPAA
jgi:hypothetical protein